MQDLGHLSGADDASSLSDATPRQPVNIYRRFSMNTLLSVSVFSSPRTEPSARTS